MQVDKELLVRFNSQIKSNVPHWNEGPSERTIINPTPLEDITKAVLECARTEFGLDLSAKNAKVFGKLDSKILTGSVKIRPAVEITEEAITSGNLRRGQTIFEATSGNFGIALGLFRELGIDVIALVSRKLQDGVVEELKGRGVKLVDLDVDICPAPGLKVDPNMLVAKSAATNVREQLADLGLSVSVFDNSRSEVEGLLGRQDVIGLARLLARIYGGFCPEQYDNQLNVKSHETVTGPEIDQQLNAIGHSFADFRMLTAFGTGGTSTGLSQYASKKYGKKLVHVVFPLTNQDVAGIRTKEKALGLRFYEPGLYAGQHEVDFEAAKLVHRFFAKKGYDIGESSALVLYSCIQMLNFGVGDKFVVLLADGMEKYWETFKTELETTKRYEVTLQEASSSLEDYGDVLWTHTMFAPRDEGIKLIASSLGCEESRIKVARARDIDALISTQQIPQTLQNLIATDKPKHLLVCMVGGTSFAVAQLLAKKGIQAESLIGGIMSLAETGGKQPPQLVQMATE